MKGTALMSGTQRCDGKAFAGGAFPLFPELLDTVLGGVVMGAELGGV